MLPPLVIEAASCLPDADSCGFLSAALLYSAKGVEPEFEGYAKGMWKMAKGLIDRRRAKGEWGKVRHPWKKKMEETEIQSIEVVEVSDIPIAEQPIVIEQPIAAPIAAEPEPPKPKKAAKPKAVTEPLNVEAIEHPMMKWIAGNAPKLLQFNKPITEAECDRLMSEYPDRKAMIGVMLAMENRPNLLKDYESANLTIRNWLRRRDEKEDPPPTKVVMTNLVPQYR